MRAAGPVQGVGAPDRVAGRGRALAYRSAPHHLVSLAPDAAGQRLARNPLPRATPRRLSGIASRPERYATGFMYCTPSARLVYPIVSLMWRIGVFLKSLSVRT